MFLLVLTKKKQNLRRFATEAEEGVVGKGWSGNHPPLTDVATYGDGV